MPRKRKSNPKRRYVIAKSGTREYFSDIIDGEVKTVTKKKDARFYYTHKTACNMALTLTLAGFPSDVRQHFIAD